MELSKLNLSDQEIKMILEGLDGLKSKDFAGEMMGMLFESMLIKKDEMTPEQLADYQQRKAKEEEVKKQKDLEKEQLKKSIDILRAKILLSSN